MNWILIAIGGAAGSVLRYGTSLALAPASGRAHWPWGTLTANLIGCLLAGYVNGLLDARLIRPELRFLLTVGFLGGYTTFSTFAYEATAYLRDGHYARAAAYVILSNAAGLALVFAGLALARLHRVT
jgi:fluoride exporter